MPQIGAVIMVGGGGTSPQETLMLAAQRASALDLIHLLQAQGIDQIVVASPSTDWVPSDLKIIRDDDALQGPFHFGERLLRIIRQYPTSALLYFGGSSAPLVDQATIGMIVGLIGRSLDQIGSAIPTHIVLTNNLNSSDWGAISRIDAATKILKDIRHDNLLASMLKASGEYDVRVLSGVRPATSIDIDTPADLALLSRHPDIQPGLKSVISDEDFGFIPIDKIIAVCRDPKKTLAVVGRVSPLAWQALEKVAHCRLVVIGESRDIGYTNAPGESVLLPWYTVQGWERLFQDFRTLADGLIFDNRPLLKSLGYEIGREDLFATDLGWVDDIQDDRLQEMYTAATRYGLPVIFGGNSLVTGGLYVLSEILTAIDRRDP